MAESSSEKKIQFVRRRDYVLVRELGQGACGRTVLLRDDQLGQMFVCKKYSPLPGLDRPTYYANFVREIQLLHQLNHINVVRVFNYYLYPETYSGYILMEHVSGLDVQAYLRSIPERTNEVFEQAIKGFKHLEQSRVLHRDIRPDNLLVGDDGLVKIIDLGFGKKIDTSDDFDKSISLNWWCELPHEFQDSTYNYSTEVYFVGKLFEKILLEENIENFKYGSLLSRMCERSQENRPDSFAAIEQMIDSNLFYEIDFSADERRAYRAFAEAVAERLVEVERGKYVSDTDRVRKNLEDALRNVMLEEFVPDATLVLGCLLTGAYRYKRTGFPVATLRRFVHLLKSVPSEKQRVLLANLHSRLDATKQYLQAQRPKTGFEDMDDDIPF